MIRHGDTGRKVIDLQARLKWLNQSELVSTALFDDATDRAVRAFQAKYSLVVDGIAGRRTLGALQSLTRDAWLYMFAHCSASKRSHKHVTGKWIAWFHTVRRHWKRPGYTDVIELDGLLTNLRAHRADRKITKDEYTWGVRGSIMNRHSHHFCYSGGIAEDGEAADTRCPAQLETMELYIKLMLRYNPSVIIAGHNQVQKKACPSFDVVEWCKSIGVPAHNLAHWGDNIKRI